MARPDPVALVALVVLKQPVAPPHRVALLAVLAAQVVLVLAARVALAVRVVLVLAARVALAVRVLAAPEVLAVRVVPGRMGQRRTQVTPSLSRSPRWIKLR